MGARAERLREREWSDCDSRTNAGVERLAERERSDCRSGRICDSRRNCDSGANAVAEAYRSVLQERFAGAILWERF